MKNLMKKIFAPLAVFALAIGVSISNIYQDEIIGGKAELNYVTEDFESQTVLTASYAAGSFVGTDDINFSYAYSRNEDTYPITGKGIMLRYADSYLMFTIPNGLSGLKFQYRKAYTGTSARQLEVLVNGTQVATTPIFGTSSGAEADIYDLVYEPTSSHAGPVTIKIKNVGTGTTNKQTVLDNLQWSYPISSDVVSSLTVTPLTQSYFTTSTLQSTDFAVSIIKNEAQGSLNDYTAKIGTGEGLNFEGTFIEWGTTKPSLSQTTIQFKALYPQTVGLEDYLFVDVAITVTTPELISIDISGSLLKTVYYTTDSWSSSGLIVTATYEDNTTGDVTSEVSWSYDPLVPNNTSITEVTMTAIFNGQTDFIFFNNVSVISEPDIDVVRFGNDFPNDWSKNVQSTGSDYVGMATTEHYVEYSFVELVGWGNILDSSLTVTFKLGTYGGGTFTPELKVELFDRTNSLVASSTGVATLDNSTESYNQGPTIVVPKPLNPVHINTIKISISNSDTMTTSKYMRFQEVSISKYLMTNDYDYASQFAYFIMSFEGGDISTPECENKFLEAYLIWDDMTSGAQNEFKTNGNFIDALARYGAWAFANNSTIDGENIPPTARNIEGTNKVQTISAVLVIGLIGLTSILGYYFINKKKGLG